MTPLLHTYNQPFSPNSSSSLPSISSTSSTSNKDELIIPQHWRPEVELCIKDKILSERARNEIIRTMVNLFFTRSRKPCRYDCGSLARKLILVYPFMKDDLGNGYVSFFILSGRSFIIYYLFLQQSWSDKMVERIRNVIK